MDAMNIERLRLEQQANRHHQVLLGDGMVGKYLASFLDTMVESTQQVPFNIMIKAKINRILRRIDEASKDSNTLGLKIVTTQRNLSSSAPTRRRDGQTSPLIDESEVNGRQGDKESIIELLMASSDSSMRNYCAIPIVGMGGVGKTTLAQLVFKDEKVKCFFAIQSWACVSDVFDINSDKRYYRICYK